MSTPLVVTVIGADRPGLVHQVSAVIAAHGGNWVDASMSRLVGHFAGIIRVDVAADQRAALEQGLAALEGDGVRVSVTPTEDPAAVPFRTLSLEVLGHDTQGIVRDITACLARLGANIERLSTGVVSAPMSGDPMFKASIGVGLPTSIDLDDVVADLEEVAAHLSVDVSVDT